MKINREKALAAFQEYTDRYDSSRDMIRLKIEHTYRVCGLCQQIARSLDLPEEEVDIAWLTGLLHDVGRFEEQRVYGTFTDADSIDHAKYGARILFGKVWEEKHRLASGSEESLSEEIQAVLAAVGHGALKEGQIVNKLNEEYQKTKKAEITDKQVLDSIVASESKEKEKEKKGKGGIVVKGIHDVAVRFSKCCNPVPGDEIVGFVTRGRGISIHRTDCVNILNFPANERARLIEAEWEQTENKDEKYSAEINIYAGNRKGLIVDISRLFTEANIDVRFMNSRVNKKQLATINLGFVVSGKEELNRLIDNLRKIDGVTDIERATG